METNGPAAIDSSNKYDTALNAIDIIPDNSAGGSVAAFFYT